MPTLNDTLHAHNIKELKKRLALLDIKFKVPRKAELVEALEQNLTGFKLATTWNSLSPAEQIAVQETCHSADLAFNEVRIKAKHGKCAPLFIPDESRSSWSRSGTPTKITLFLYSSKYQHGHFIPNDLAETLRKMVPAPEALTIPVLPNAPEEEGLTIRQTEYDALRELTTILRLAEQGNLRITAKTGFPTASGKKALAEAISTGDFFPPEVASPPKKNDWDQEIGPIKPIAWVRLLIAAKLVTAGGTRSPLSPAGVKALSKPPHETIRLLWKKWQSNILFDEFNRVDEIQGQKAKGHMTAKPPRRSAIASALFEAPANQWIDVTKFSSYMRAEDLTFEISRDPWKLYISDREYGALGYDGTGGWNMLQFRYLLTVLFEYAATLGLIDIAYCHPEGALNDLQDQWGGDDLKWLSRYDGLRAFRITDLGAYCFGKSNSYTPIQPETSLSLTVSSKLAIQLTSPEIQLSERMLIETWATPIKSGLWQLDPTRARDAIERGNTIKDFLTFLKQCNEQPLPKKVDLFLQAAVNDAQALKRAGDAIFFDCRDTKTADILFKEKALKAICFRCGDTRLAIPAEHLPKFQKHIRKLGLGFA